MDREVPRAEQGVLLRQTPLVLELPQGCKPVTLEWSGGRVALSKEQGRTLLLAGFGSAPLALAAERRDAQDRQGQIELFEIAPLDESAAREWIDKRPSEFVPNSGGDVSIVHSTLKF